MAIPTSRTNETGRIMVDSDACKGCGRCVDVCKDFSLTIKDGKVAIAPQPLFGCIGCGHCMAICPNGAIRVEGRFISATDLYTLPDKRRAASYDAVLALLQRRRSIREFSDKEVEPEVLDKMLAVAKTVPMGLSPSDVNILVLASKDSVR